MRKNTIIAIAIGVPDHGSGNVTGSSGLALQHQSPRVINTYCQAVTNLVDED